MLEKSKVGRLYSVTRRAKPKVKTLDEQNHAIRESEDLYNKLEYVITPMFYERHDEWIRLMKNSIGKIAYYFNSHRMMRRYVTEAYL